MPLCIRQTGAMIAGHGVVIDRVVSDFAAGAVAWLGGGHPYRDNAFEHWRKAAQIGREYGAPAANMASERLSYLELNCPTSRASLDRIAAGPGDPQPVIARQISLADRKRALKVLGYFSGEIDDKPDWAMRDAILRFQSSLWFSPADGLRPEQVTLLICAAAQKALDPDMQDLLGIMFAAGIGVVRGAGGGAGAAGGAAGTVGRGWLPGKALDPAVVRGAGDRGAAPAGGPGAGPVAAPARGGPSSSAC